MDVSIVWVVYFYSGAVYGHLVNMGDVFLGRSSPVPRITHSPRQGVATHTPPHRHYYNIVKKTTQKLQHYKHYNTRRIDYVVHITAINAYIATSCCVVMYR